MLEKKSMTALVRKLVDIGGGQGVKLEAMDWNIRKAINWHTKAKSAVRHMLNGERKIDVDEARQIEVAHFEWCARKAAANAEETKQLFAAMRSALDAMEMADAEFFGPQIEAFGQMLLQHRHQSGETGVEG
jgi:sigma54-dependent transcription regulator